MCPSTEEVKACKVESNGQTTHFTCHTCAESMFCLPRERRSYQELHGEWMKYVFVFNEGIRKQTNTHTHKKKI